LSEKPERIKKLVQKNKINDSNIYQANAFINGKPVSIVMDDFFPIIESENKLAFAGINPESKNIWPLIIEKAYAKANGSYEDIVSGNCSDACRFLTPAPVETIYHDFEDKTIFEKIQNYLAKGFLVMCDITNTDNTNLDALAKMGLVTNHAYSVVDAVVLKQNFGEIKLLKIKNIWGTNEWLGDWSDGSYKWTDEFKKKSGARRKGRRSLLDELRRLCAILHHNSCVPLSRRL
jgi:calpain-15